MIGPLPVSAVPGALDPITASMAGQNLSQAWESQNMSDPYDLGFGVQNWTSSEPAITGHTENTVKTSSEPDPIDAFDEAAETDQISEITGGILTGSAVGTVNYSLLKLTNGDVKAVMPVAVPVDVAMVAGAQVLGVSMDAAEMDVETKQKFASSIVSGSGLVYDKAKGLVKAWWDGVKILFPKKTIEAIQTVLEEEGIIVQEEKISDLIDYAVPIAGYSYTFHGSSGGDNYTTKYTYTANRPIAAWFPNASHLQRIVATDSSSDTITITNNWVRSWDNGTVESGTAVSTVTPNLSYTYDGKTVWYSSLTSSGEHSDPVGTIDNGNVIDVSAGTVAWTALYGTTVSGEFPEGTEPSQATSYTLNNLPDEGGIATSSTETEPVVSVNIPENMTNTIGSTVDPISSTDDDTVSDLPLPPIPLPIPDTNVYNPDVPLTDASVVDAALIDELVDSLANTLDPQPPQSSGLIPFPLMPGIPVDPDDPSAGTQYPSIVPSSGSGLIHVYNPTPAEFVSFGNWLWVTYADATIDKIWNNPFDGIIGAHELYATPSNDGTDNIRSGFLVCPTTAALVRQRYTEIDCGTVIVPEFYGNYLDYSPYSQAYIYLPFIGIQEVSVDDIVGHAVNIRYRVDAYNGSCIAMIYVAKQGYRNLCYQFAGNCAVEVPLAGGSQAAIKAGMMQAEAYATAGVQSAGLTGIAQALGGLAGGLAHGGLAGAIGGLASGVISGLANYGAAKINAGATREAARVANKSSVQHSGTFGASHGAMGLKIPFIMIRNPIQVKVVNYNDDYGFPAHKRVIIGGCTGYLRVKEVNVISAHATNEEKIAIEEALKAGVYVT